MRKQQLCKREKFFQAETEERKHTRDEFLKAKNNTFLQVMKKNSFLKTTRAMMKMMKRE